MEQRKERHELPLRLGFHMPELILAVLQNSLLILGLRPPSFCAEQLPWGRMRLGHYQRLGHAFLQERYAQTGN